ncbi:MAG: glycoside hydrolase family 127 protein, partial [Lachnospiraceae bacterium]|nr:glycoside hydrolase family 127 protein [Lachnospiraceae bacterium]
MKKQRQASIKSYKADGFIGKYQRLIKDVVIPYQYSVLCDEAPDTEKSHVVQNFINAGRAIRGEDTGDGFYGMVFQDSDAAKWIEAAAYSLSLFPDKDLEKTVDDLIAIIADAQDSDGYLNTYYTIKDKDKRWTNLQEGHELYCSGHMMEAACAYYEATGKDALLKVMLKNAEHIYNHFITEGHEGCPGHPEVELALLKMYRLTDNKHCLELAAHFINTRGQNPGFYEEEKEKRVWCVWSLAPVDTDYLQGSKPVREQADAVGHAVRAVYLYTAMADLAASTDDTELLDACRKLWESITKRRMYLTGGIGSTGLGEAFTVDFDLPNDTAYAETCASIGLIFFASRMLESEVKGEYGDVCERAFYNTVLAGMQLDGRRFFYVNPLEVVPGISGIAVTHKHDLPVRPKWYACACCPPNVARLISSFGKYAYGENADTAFCHMFADGEVCLENGMKFT